MKSKLDVASPLQIPETRVRRYPVFTQMLAAGALRRRACRAHSLPREKWTSSSTVLY